MSASATAEARPRWSATARRVSALARAELRLLLRNRTAMFAALLLPVLTVGGVRAIGVGEDGDLPAGALTVTMLTGFVLLYVVYYNLVTVFVARREELVLKRLRTGEVSDGEILVGMATPAVTVAIVQVLLGWVVAAVPLGLDAPVNALLVVFALVAGVVIFVLLAGASTAITRNVETAQLSTLPVLIACMIFSRLVVPPEAMSESLRSATQLLPLSPVIDLLRLGLTGQTPDGDTVGLGASFSAAGVPAAIAIAWVVLAGWALRRWFRWEPRT